MACGQAFAITEPHDGQKISSFSIIIPQSSQSPANAMAVSACAATCSSSPPQQIQNSSPLSDSWPQSPQVIFAALAVFAATKPSSAPVIRMTSSDCESAPLFAGGGVSTATVGVCADGCACG